MSDMVNQKLFPLQVTGLIIRLIFFLPQRWHRSLGRRDYYHFLYILAQRARSLPLPPLQLSGNVLIGRKSSVTWAQFFALQSYPVYFFGLICRKPCFCILRRWERLLSYMRGRILISEKRIMELILFLGQGGGGQRRGVRMLLWQSSYGIIWRRRLKESIDSLSRKLAYRRRGRIV